MKIDIILPNKELFSSKKASAVSITVNNSIKFSKYKKNISVFGQKTENPYFKKNFFGFKTNKIFSLGKNLLIAKNYLKISKLFDCKNRIIEIHNRPYIFHYIYSRLPNAPIILYFHNDPQTMKGSITVSDRKKIIQNASGVIFVSEFLKKKFLNGIDKDNKNLYVLPNSLDKNYNVRKNKEKNILFVGRLVEEKGPKLFVEVVKDIAENYPKWKFIIVGTAKAAQKNLTTNFEKKIIKDFLNIGKNVKYYGFLSNQKVKNLMSNSSILVVPSIWQEPFGMTALEGLANKMAVIGSNVGGLKSILYKRGVLINKIDKIKLKNVINKLINNPNELRRLQNSTWNGYCYGQRDISLKQDNYREKIIKYWEKNLKIKN